MECQSGRPQIDTAFTASVDQMYVYVCVCQTVDRFGNPTLGG